MTDPNDGGREIGKTKYKNVVDEVSRRGGLCRRIGSVEGEMLAGYVNEVKSAKRINEQYL
jgi:hypothetical protein